METSACVYITASHQESSLCILINLSIAEYDHPPACPRSPLPFSIYYNGTKGEERRAQYTRTCLTIHVPVVCTMTLWPCFSNSLVLKGLSWDTLGILNKKTKLWWTLYPPFWLCCCKTHESKALTGVFAPQHPHLLSLKNTPTNQWPFNCRL